jgi:predicted SprT family Zn-dependent metalloprotease
MSKESVQFIEMIRQAAAQQTYQFFCENCGGDRKFVFVRDQGNREIYRCLSCQTEKSYTVR